MAFIAVTLHRLPLRRCAYALAEDIDANQITVRCLTLHAAAFSTCDITRGREAHRWTSTGILEWVSTLTVSLPRMMAEMPWRPCDAMTIRSQPFDPAVSIIAR